MPMRKDTGVCGSARKAGCSYNNNTVKHRFTGPLGGKELGPVNREARYIGVHFTLIYPQACFWVKD